MPKGARRATEAALATGTDVPEGKHGQCATHRADGVGSRVARASRHPAEAIWQCAALQSQPGPTVQSVLGLTGLHGRTAGRARTGPRVRDLLLADCDRASPEAETRKQTEVPG